MLVKAVSRRRVLTSLLQGMGLAAFAGALSAAHTSLAADARVSLIAALKPYADAIKQSAETALQEKTLQEKPSLPVARYLLNADEEMPFPIVRKKRGEIFALDFSNTLPWSTSFYIDGLRCDNANLGIVGLTSEAIQPAAKQALDIALPDSGVYWFSAHNTEPLRPQEASLYGVLIVEEDTPPAVADDVIIILHNQPTDLPNAAPQLCINGKLDPVQKQYRPASRIRLRLINATASSILFLGTSGLNATVIGIDGQPCDSFTPARATLPLAPGARYDMLCDLPEIPSDVRLLLTASAPSYPARAPNLLTATAPADNATSAPVSSPQSTANTSLLTATPIATGAVNTLGEQARALMIVQTSGEALPKPAPLTNLPTNPLLPFEIALQKSKRVTLTLSEITTANSDTPRYSINSESAHGYAAKPSFSVAKNTPVTLTITNKTNSVQTIRLCGQVCRVLHQFDDGWEPYWRNSVVVTEGHSMTVVLVPDRVGKWAIESAVDTVRLSGMASWFLVT